MSVTALAESQAEKSGKKYFVNIEGREIAWDRPTITAAEIAELGGWVLSQGGIEVDKDNVEHQLRPDETVELQPGHGFSKKVKWQRGDSVLDVRLDEELLLIRSRFPLAARTGYWIHLGTVKVPGQGWNRSETEIVIRAPSGFPGVTPYGIFVPAGIRVNGTTPDNYQEPVTESLPFSGTWGQFSWQADGGRWHAGATP